jgi:N-acetylneuraminate synthase
LNPVFEIAGRTIGAGKPCFLVAEVAQAHDGSLGMAQAFVDVAADIGVDAIKFQTHIASAESTSRETFRVPVFPQDKTRYDYWQRTSFTPDQWRYLADRARGKGLTFLSSPFSIQAVDLLAQCGVPAWKIASGEVTNLPLLEHIAQSGLPVLISSGMSSWEELRQAVGFFRERRIPTAVMQCTSAYPCPPETWGLNLIGEMRREFNCPVGFSDHSGSMAPSLAAVTLGANVIEFHLAFHRKMFGPDVPSSLTIEQATELVGLIRQLETALHSPVDKDQLARDATRVRSLFSKSVVAARSLPPGTVLERGHLDFKKPGDGIPADRYRELLGRRTTKAVDKDEPFSEANVQ